MARTKDLWFSDIPVKDAAGYAVRDDTGHVVTAKRKTARHPDNGGNKDAKRFLACWIDPDGNEKTKAFRKQADAKAHAAKMEGDVSRHEYIDPKAGREKFGDLAAKFLRLRAVGGSSRDKYDSTYRHQVAPAFADRSVRSVKPSEVLEWLRSPAMTKMSVSVQATAYLIVAGTFDLAVADSLRRDNPARSPIITPPQVELVERKPPTVPQIWRIHDEIAEPYRPIVAASAALGLRQGEALALAEEDFDFDAQQVHIRRQVLFSGSVHAFKLPKEGKTRTAPLPRGLAAIIQAHIEAHPPKPYELRWMNEDGELAEDPHSCRILFRWHGSDRRTHGKHIRASQYSDGIWKPALMRAGIIPAGEEGKVPRWIAGDSGGNGAHLLRHFYSTTLQDAGVSPAGITEFMGHSKKALPITFRVYGHVTEETFEQGRQAIDRVLFRLRPVESAGTVTELRAAT
jgi:integrase